MQPAEPASNAPRYATPADAQAVWESIVKAGGRGSARAVARSLSQSGQFRPVHNNTVNRWRKAGWTRPETDATPRDALNKAADAVDAAVPVLTGDATTRTVDLVPSSKALTDDELSALPLQDLMSLASRKAYITAIRLLERMQTKIDLMDEMPREIGSLQAALTGSLTAANGAVETMLSVTERIMRTVDGKNALGPEEDPLKDAWAAFDKASAAAA